MLKVKEAKEELSKKSYKDIQEETAYKWASRASASYELVLEVERSRKLVTWTLAGEYYHEAIEHAALVDDETENTVKKIQKDVDPYQEKALRHLETIFNQNMSEEKED